MTKREKLRILKAMKVKLAEREKIGHYGYLCLCYREVQGLRYTPYPDVLLRLGITRPKRVWWWTKFDYTSRLRALNKAIRKLEPKK